MNVRQSFKSFVMSLGRGWLWHLCCSHMPVLFDIFLLLFCFVNTPGKVLGRQILQFWCLLAGAGGSSLYGFYAIGTSLGVQVMLAQAACLICQGLEYFSSL